MSDLKTQLAVIGGGPGGYAAAFMAADLGLDVTLIDVEDNPGGTCLFRGCIPSKALLHVAKLLNETREAGHFGLSFEEPTIDLDRVRQSTQDVVTQMTGGLGQLCKSRNVNFIKGRAVFEGSKTLIIYEDDSTEETLEFEHAIIAAGSRPAMFGPLIDSPRIMNSTGALEMEDIPESLLVIGGGYIGLELGSVYSSFGSEVTVVEAMDGLLMGADRDLVRPLEARLREQFNEVLTSTKVTEMKEQKNGMKVTLEGPDVKRKNRVFDKVLVCVGRKPNASGLGLKNTKVKVDDRGFILVDEQCRTADANIFAIGDIVGGAMLAHKATAEGRVAAEVIAGRDVAFEPQAIPAVIFTDPELAWTGITETEAKESGRNVHVARFPWAASGRATTFNRTEGLTKVITDSETHQILGMGVVGHGAGELIAEGSLAIEMGATASDLELTIHPHPTLSETVMDAAASVFGTATYMHRPKK